MSVIICKNYEEVSAQAAKIVASQLVLRPDSILGLATGFTPVGMYNLLAEMNKKGEIDFEAMIDAAGGIDLQVLGIGQNGHIGFNEPDTFLYADTHHTDLTESTINANSRFFDKIEDVPTKALTMGIATILKSKKIIILASGANKRDVITDLIEGEISANNPASMLKLHKDVIVICDKEAYSK